MLGCFLDYFPDLTMACWLAGYVVSKVIQTSASQFRDYKEEESHITRSSRQGEIIFYLDKKKPGINISYSHSVFPPFDLDIGEAGKPGKCDKEKKVLREQLLCEDYIGRKERKKKEKIDIFKFTRLSLSL